MQNKLITLSEQPATLKRGVLYLKGKPIYIVETLEGKGEAPYISVFAVHPRSNPPIKHYKKEEVAMKFKETTVLGQLAAKTIKTKAQRRTVEYPPLFLATIIDGVDTFTGKVGKGFWEREKDQTVLSGTEAKVIRGDRTGVFISLESIKWEKIIIPTEEVIKDLKAREILWFQL